MRRLLVIILFAMYPHTVSGTDEFPGPVTATVFRVVNPGVVVVHSHAGIAERGIVRVTMADIATPSPDGKCKREMNLAVKARMLLLDYIGAPVYLYDLSFQPFTSPSVQRVTARVVLQGGTELGQRLVEAGLARWTNAQPTRSWCQ